MNARRTIAILTVLTAISVSRGTVVELKNGMEIEGSTALLTGIAEDVLNPGAKSNGVQLVLVVDNGLTRTFVSKYQVVNSRQEFVKLEKIRLDQNVAKKGPPRLGNIGAIVRIEPFDQWGRRTFSMLSPKGRLDVVQGITEFTPHYTRVQGLNSKKPYIWDMRIATSSIPPNEIRKIIGNHLDMDDADVMLSIARLHLQSERYKQAEEELALAIEKFPGLEALKKKLKELRQLKARQQLNELKLRQNAAQHGFVSKLLSQFPNTDVAGEILLEVSELYEDYEKEKEQGESILESIEGMLPSVKSKPRRDALDAFYREISLELNHNTLPRMADFLRLREDPKLDDEQKLALAISAWLLNDTGIDNVSVACSLWEAREIINQYLLSRDPNERKRLVDQLTSLEGGAAKYVAKILATMKPPRRTRGLLYHSDENLADTSTTGSTAAEPPQESADEFVDYPLEKSEFAEDGYFRIELPGIRKSKPVAYHVQLPPEYDPDRKYPTIVTLHAAGSNAKMQIAWWAAQAGRHGYIVIAPEWGSERQQRYGYSAEEHAMTTFSLRNAMQRFSIDSDRIFLSGHGMGADASWDIGLAHPDMWAGVIPIGGVALYEANSPRYVSLYWKNGRHVALYFVVGSLDAKKIGLNSMDWNRYLKTTGFDATIVEYRGRGDEHFQDEIQRLFRWMNLHSRDFYPREIEVRTMRPWDNYFWWLEVAGLPKGAIILPGQWPAKGRPTLIDATVRQKKDISVKVGTSNATAWLSPDIVDLESDVTITVNGRRNKLNLNPDLAVMLEDARQRGDRQHPFWTKVELRTGKRN